MEKWVLRKIFLKLGKIFFPSTNPELHVDAGVKLLPPSPWTLYCVRFIKETREQLLQSSLEMSSRSLEFRNPHTPPSPPPTPHFFPPYFGLSGYGHINASLWLRVFWNLLDKLVCNQNSRFALFPTFREGVYLIALLFGSISPPQLLKKKKVDPYVSS